MAALLLSSDDAQCSVWLHQPEHVCPMTPRSIRPVSAAALCAATALWLLVVDNAGFWRTLWAARDLSSSRSILAVVALAAVLWLLFSLILRMLCWRWVGKPLLATVLLVSALAAHFIGNYGVLIDKGMIRNVLQTDWREAADLSSAALWWDFAWRGLLPAALVLAVPVKRLPWPTVAAGVAKHAVALTLLLLAALAAFYADYAAAARNHRELRHLLTPTNVVNGFVGLWKGRAQPAAALIAVGADAVRPAAAGSRKPLLVVLVVGETARAANFSLGGYARATNQALAGKGVVYFDQVTACGTDTATSLPCMFSDLGAQRFSVAAAAARENALDVLQRAGVAVRWLDNNSGCKGVCQRVDTQFPGQGAMAGPCGPEECFDEVLLRGLQAAMTGPATGKDSLVVLHMKGSHGPAYYKRYPSGARRFAPTCDTNQIQSCERQALINTYDNSIAYTSEVLAQTIDWLAGESERMDSLLLYVSDHGESLGEGKVYLHGLPMLLAPTEQTAIPMMAWISAGIASRLQLDAGALQGVAGGTYSHNNLFHTLLGAFGTQTQAYRPELDLWAAARAARRTRETAATR